MEIGTYKVRKSNGQFSKKTTWSIIFLGFAVGIIIANYTAISPWIEKMNNEVSVTNTVMPVFIPQKVEAAVTLESKVESLKDDVLNQLAACESGGKKEEDGITILDTNGVGSYGAFQFQRKTVMFYHEKMTGEKINGRDAIILALTPDKARELAKYIIFETKAGVANDWVNCSRIHDLQTQVDLIKKLTD